MRNAGSKEKQLLRDLLSSVRIDPEVRNWFHTRRRKVKTVFHHPHLSNIHPETEIGHSCVIHSHVWIGRGVTIGDFTKVQAFAFIPTGVKIGEHCFIGPHVCFTNDKMPPSGREHWQGTIVGDGAVIGAGAVILPGVKIGKSSTVGAGAVVTKDVPPGTTVVGNPAVDIRKSKR